MYLTNKYTQCYYNIIARAQKRINSAYTEKHHIIPKSLGGSDQDANLVKLTAREHFICHRLLCKMVSGKQKQSMVYALWKMTMRNKKQKRYIPNSRIYDNVKKLLSDSKKGVKLSEKHKQSMRVPKGPMSSEEKQKRSDANKGKLKTEETKKKMSEAKKKMWADRKKIVNSVDL